MTIELRRDDFAHMTRRRQLSDGRWQTVCACGWLSRPEAHPDLLGWTCPERSLAAWYPGTVGTHYAGKPLEPVTPESIAAAKAARDRERRQAEQELGIRILEDGTIIHPPPTHPRVQ